MLTPILMAASGICPSFAACQAPEPAPLAADAQDRRVSEQEFHAAGAFGLRPSLVHALSAVHVFDRQCLNLGLYKSDGTLNHQALPRDAGPDHPILRFLEWGESPSESAGGGFIYPGLRGFHFPALAPSLDELLECTRYHVGFLAFQRALDEDPGLRAEHVLAALAHRCLVAAPLEGTLEAQRLHKRALAQNRMAILGNGSFCYLAWGMLQSERFWADAKDGARDRIIQAILRMAPHSDVSTWMCQRVLNPPLIPTDEQPGKGVARAFDPNRGVIGFTDEHQAFVRGIRNSCLPSERVVGPSEAPLNVARQSATKSGISASAPRLRAWSSVMLDRILRERGTAEVADAALRDGSFDERLQFWRSLVRSAPFEDFNAAYVDELRRMSGGTDGFPGSARIEELQGLAQERGLSPGEEAELAGLRSELRGSRQALIQELGRLLVASGGPLNVAAVAATLAGPTEELLGATGGIVPGGLPRRSVLGAAWVQLGLVQSDQSAWVVTDHLAGAVQLPSYALDSMVGLLPVHRPVGFEAVLDEVLQSDSALMQSRAIVNPSWMDPDRFRSEFARLSSSYSEGDLKGLAREQLRLNLVGALTRRGDSAGRELLLKTFEEGRWKSGPGGWSSGLSKGPWIQGLWAKLKPGERDDFIRRGLAPAGLFD